MPSVRKLFRATLLAAVLSCLCILCASAASQGVGTVNAGALRLRSEANTGSAILATAPKGATVLVLENAGDGWYKVDYKSISGYMFGEYLDIEEQVETELGYGLVDTFPDHLNCRSGPGTGYDVVASLAPRTVVTLTGLDNDWYSIEYKGLTGYVSARYIVPCLDASGTRADQPEVDTSSLGQQVVDYAITFLGTPYVSGGNGPYSFDCSGFTKFVYAHFGYSLYRTQTDQLNNGAPVPIDIASLRPGDLIFFDNNPAVITGHVGIYVGDGQFIHASTNKYQVELRSLYDWNGYYMNILKFARRIV